MFWFHAIIIDFVVYISLYTLLWSPYVVSFYLFSLPNLSGRTLDVYHTSTHGVALVPI